MFLGHSNPGPSSVWACYTTWCMNTQECGKTSSAQSLSATAQIILAAVARLVTKQATSKRQTIHLRMHLKMHSGEKLSILFWPVCSCEACHQPTKQAKQSMHSSSIFHIKSDTLHVVTQEHTHIKHTCRHSVNNVYSISLVRIEAPSLTKCKLRSAEIFRKSFQVDYAIG